jgi:ceramide glucosyltransferase
MATRRKQLAEIGGFAALQNCLADDYLLGNRIARRGHRIDLCPVVVECWSGPMGWRDVWQHQLRWARTIRVCQPLPYFFSILGNATLWPLLWAAIYPAGREITFALCFWLTRIGTALNLQQLLTGTPAPLGRAWLAPVKDLLQAVLWLMSFLGNRVEWRGEKMRIRRDGTLIRDGFRRPVG